MQLSNSSARRGFTLIELLTVIALIAILGAIIGQAFVQGGAGALRSGEALAMSMAKSARMSAALNDTRARLIINNNISNRERWRQLGVVVQDKGPDGELDTVDDFWRAINDGVFLPDGIYYIPNDYVPADAASRGSVASAELPVSTFNYRRIQGNTYTANMLSQFEITFPRIADVNDNPKDWYFYEYEADGTTNNPQARFILAYGEKLGDPVSGEDPISLVHFPDQYRTAGFILRRSGGLARIQDPGSLDK